VVIGDLPVYFASAIVRATIVSSVPQLLPDLGVLLLELSQGLFKLLLVVLQLVGPRR
jgi:hypothetical protein